MLAEIKLREIAAAEEPQTYSLKVIWTGETPVCTGGVVAGLGVFFKMNAIVPHFAGKWQGIYNPSRFDPGLVARRLEQSSIKPLTLRILLISIARNRKIERNYMRTICPFICLQDANKALCN